VDSFDDDEMPFVGPVVLGLATLDGFRTERGCRSLLRYVENAVTDTFLEDGGLQLSFFVFTRRQPVSGEPLDGECLGPGMRALLKREIGVLSQISLRPGVAYTANNEALLHAAVGVACEQGQAAAVIMSSPVTSKTPEQSPRRGLYLCLETERIVIGRMAPVSDDEQLGAWDDAPAALGDFIPPMPMGTA
jgi:hypothetical protein